MTFYQLPVCWKRARHNRSTTIEYAVGDETTWVDRQPCCIVSGQRLAVAILKVTRRTVMPEQLLRIDALDVSAVVLVVVCKLVVKENACIQLRGNAEVYEASHGAVLLVVRLPRPLGSLEV